MQFDFGVTRSPSRIIFGAGQRNALGALAATLGRRVLLCTDARLGSDRTLVEMRADLLRNGLAVEVFADTEAELPLAGIEACVGAYRSFSPEIVVGVGGGSCLDMAKLVSLLLTHDAPISTFYGEFKVPGPILPIVAVPTTAGTGSEVTPVAVLADPSQEMKIGISSPELIPHTAICDPELTLTCPPSLTAISGADALAHAIEAFAAVRREVSPDIALQRVFVGKNALSDQYALTAIRLLCKWLPAAVSNGEDLEARSAVMLAATLAGLAFGSAGTAAAHALQYPVGAKTHTAHGLGVGILLPYTMEFNLTVSAATYSEIAAFVGLHGASDDVEGARAFIRLVRQVFAAIGIPESLAAIGFESKDIDWASERALRARRLIENNPRQIDLPGAAAILRSALYGNHNN